MTTPRAQDGWPVLEQGSPLLHQWVIPTRTGTVKITMRNGSAGFILAWFVLRLAETIVPVFGKVLDDWGWAFRPIRGYSTGYSNHAAGTAVDVNASKHPLGRVGTWVARQVVQIHALLKLRKLRGVIRWGGDYHGRKDEMHFEIVGDLQTCEAVARVLMNTPRGQRLLKANPTQKAVILS